jgi:HNH endonuclease
MFSARHLDSIHTIPETGCWWWIGNNNPQGYGQVFIDGRNRGAHRYSYELHKGEIPEGLWVLHSCDNPSCVNPDHLSTGTPQQNAKEAVERLGRGRGERSGKTHLTEEQVLMAYNSKETHQKLATKLGVSRSTVTGIKRGAQWSWLTGHSKVEGRNCG